MFVGEIKAWCEAARSEAKDMSLSAPFHPEDYEFLLAKMEKLAQENEVNFYLEKSLLTTDLFADVDMTDRWVFIIFKKEHIIEKYLDLKTEKENLEAHGKYVGRSREEIARKMGKLLGYSDSYTMQLLLMMTKGR